MGIPQTFTFEPIGVVHTEDKRQDLGYLSKRDIEERSGTIEVYHQFVEGLKDISGFSHLYIIFVFHRSHTRHLIAQTPYDGREHGVFTTRSPKRPNPIGLTIVRLLQREGNNLHIQGVDMIDGTPVLDIKPYFSWDIYENIKEGWME